RRVSRRLRAAAREHVRAPPRHGSGVSLSRFALRRRRRRAGRDPSLARSPGADGGARGGAPRRYSRARGAPRGRSPPSAFSRGRGARHATRPRERARLRPEAASHPLALRSARERRGLSGRYPPRVGKIRSAASRKALSRAPFAPSRARELAIALVDGALSGAMDWEYALGSVPGTVRLG